MSLKLLARACPQNIIKVIKYFSYWVNWSDVARSQSSSMGQNDPSRPSSVKLTEYFNLINLGNAKRVYFDPSRYFLNFLRNLKKYLEKQINTKKCLPKISTRIIKSQI